MIEDPARAHWAAVKGRLIADSLMTNGAWQNIATAAIGGWRLRSAYVATPET
jgi:hypothetical protein